MGGVIEERDEEVRDKGRGKQETRIKNQESRVKSQEPGARNQD